VCLNICVHYKCVCDVCVGHICLIYVSHMCVWCMCQIHMCNVCVWIFVFNINVCVMYVFDISVWYIQETHTSHTYITHTCQTHISHTYKRHIYDTYTYIQSDNMRRFHTLEDPCKRLMYVCDICVGHICCMCLIHMCNVCVWIFVFNINVCVMYVFDTHV